MLKRLIDWVRTEYRAMHREQLECERWDALSDLNAARQRLLAVSRRLADLDGTAS